MDSECTSAARPAGVARMALLAGAVACCATPGALAATRVPAAAAQGGSASAVTLALLALAVGAAAVALASLARLRRRRRSEPRLGALFDHSPMPMMLRSLDGRIERVNRAFERAYGVQGERLEGAAGLGTMPAATVAMLAEGERRVLDTGRPVEQEHVVPTGDRARRFLSLQYPLTGEGGAVSGIISALLDITDRGGAAQALERSETRYQDLYDNAPDMYFTLDDAHAMRSVNRFGADYLGYSRADLEGRPFLDIVHPADRLQVTELLGRILSGDGAAAERKAEFRIVGTGGAVVWVHMRARRVGERWGVHGTELNVICRDITEAHKLSQELAHQASHDALTGLVNRREFERRLGRALKQLRGTDDRHALCNLDLDQFKVVNDTCGHLAGDELLRQVGAVLRENVRSRDVVARLGGDEFAIFMEHCDQQQARRVADAVLAALEKFRFAWNEQVFMVGASIGLVPVTAAMTSSVEALGAADSACFVAKDQGRNQVHVYGADSTVLARRQGEIRWLARINRALEHDEFELWYQPIHGIVTAGDGRDARHVELLLRLAPARHPVLLPGAFLSSAERFHLVGRVDRWVVAKTLEFMAGHRGWMEEYGLFFVNLSGQSISEESFLPFVLEQFSVYGVDARRVCFELTETAVISNLSRANDFMLALRDAGCAFALDDFGSGISSLAHLKGLPVDYLKIDGTFVRDMVEDPVDAAMVRSITDIARVMGKHTIAEFVERQETLDALVALGVEFAQGYHVGRPQPLSDAPARTVDLKLVK